MTASRAYTKKRNIKAHEETRNLHKTYKRQNYFYLFFFLLFWYWTDSNTNFSTWHFKTTTRLTKRTRVKRIVCYGEFRVRALATRKRNLFNLHKLLQMQVMMWFMFARSTIMELCERLKINYSTSGIPSLELCLVRPKLVHGLHASVLKKTFAF